MPYSSLLKKLQILFRQHNITGLSVNSTSIKENEAFFAIKGKNYDGNKFILDALNQKAGIIITDNNESVELNPAKIIYVKNARIALSLAAKIFYPKEPPYLIAVTGTNGKSSVVSYIAQLYSLLGKNAATLGTLGVEYFGDIKSPEILEDTSSLTTPDPINFRKIIHNLAENEIEYLAFEASSHGLDQERLYGIKVNVACFTSFSRDHLDYHQTKDAYLLAKLKLFTNHLLPDGIAILNSDIEEIEFIKDYLNRHNVKFITVGQAGELKITKTISSIQGQNINFTFNNRNYEFTTPIIGSFQASNLLIAAMAVHNTGFAFNKVVSVLTKVKAVKGRMERVQLNSESFRQDEFKEELSYRTKVREHRRILKNSLVSSFLNDAEKHTNIFVDYAHTLDALEKALSELKNIKLKGSKLIVIFGCGGNRDKSKRSLMGEIAARIADNVIITDDNPRNENPASIRKEIISGMSKANYIEIADREEAIKYGINNLQTDDILLIAGKGHENYQIIGDKKIPFDDIEIAKKYAPRCHSRENGNPEKHLK